MTSKGAEIVQRREPQTELEDLAASGDYNVLRPIVHVVKGEAVSQAIVQDVAVVKISPDKRSGDVYNDFRYAPENKDKFALTAQALTRLATAAGIKWVPDLCRVADRQRRPGGHVYVRYQAAGAVRMENGEWHIETAEKEIDTEDVAEQLADGYRRKLEREGRNARFRPDQIPEMVRRDVLQLREFVLGHAETKAKNRVIRRLLTIPQVFTKSELSRPFVVPRLLFRPDAADPLQLERVQIEGSRATAALYGDRAIADQTPATTARPDHPRPETESEAEAAEKSSRTGSRSRGRAREKAEPRGRSGPGGGEAKTKDQPKRTKPFEGGYAGEEPNADPLVDEKPHVGERFSRIIEIDPDYIRQIAKTSKNATRRAIALQWLEYAGLTVDQTSSEGGPAKTSPSPEAESAPPSDGGQGQLA